MCSARAPVFLVLVFLANFIAATVLRDGETSRMQPSTEKQMLDCFQEGDFQCMRRRALVNLFDLIKGKSVELFDGFKLQYSGEDTARALADQGWDGFFNFIPRLIKGLSVKVNVVPGGSLVMSRSQKDGGLVDVSVEVGREFEGRNSEKRKAMMSILMFGGLYTTLFVLGLAAAKFLAFKGVAVGAVALVLAIINGLSRLFNNRTHAYQYGYAHADGYGNFKRSFNDDFVLSSIAEEEQF